LRALGLNEKSKEQISLYIGEGVNTLIKRALGNDQERLFEKALTVYVEHFRTHPTDYSVLYPNVREVLGHFREKKKIIVTNGRYEFACLILKNLGIFDYFEEILGGDDGECMKPSACPLERVLSKFMIHKEKALMVGDMTVDILMGKSAGVMTCAVTYGIGKKADVINAQPDFILNTLQELKDIIC
jgi:HAD superfamily hydrolase (TIGR01549 family)